MGSNINLLTFHLFYKIFISSHYRKKMRISTWYISCQISWNRNSNMSTNMFVCFFYRFSKLMFLMSKFLSYRNQFRWSKDPITLLFFTLQCLPFSATTWNNNRVGRSPLLSAPKTFVSIHSTQFQCTLYQQRFHL